MKKKFIADQKQNKTDVDTIKKGLENPQKKYPVPPFNAQLQPWPGLAGKMNPRPDHGEKSCSLKLPIVLN